MSQKERAAPLITHRHLFGLRSDVVSNVHYLDNGNKLLYPCGHNVVIYDRENHTQQFIHGSDVHGLSGPMEISALAVSPTKRYAAIAERGSKKCVNLFDLRSLRLRKVLSCDDLKTREFVSVCFSADNKNLFALGGAPDWTIVCWMWGKNHIMARTVVPCKQETLRQISVCPNDISLICVTGDRHIFFFRNEGDGQPFRLLDTQLLQDMEENDYLCHAWTSGRQCVVGTKSGDLIVFDNGIYRCRIPLPENLQRMAAEEKAQERALRQSSAALDLPGESSDEKQQAWLERSGEEGMAERPSFFSVFAIDSFDKVRTSEDGGDSQEEEEQEVVHERAFVCGRGRGLVQVYTPDENLVYKCTRSLSLPNCTARLDTVSVSPDGLDVAVTMSNQQAYVVPGFSDDDRRPEDLVFEPLDTLVHQGAITGMDVCIRKPLIVTCGEDMTVRIWNYETHQLELMKRFTDRPLSVAFHPSGLHILVGFEDSLRLINVLMNDLATYKEIKIKGCEECQFSNGGHLFSAVHGQGIQIYSTYTCQQIAVFRGHSGVVRSLYWSLDDSAIISAGFDGNVYDYRLNQTTRAQEYTLKDCQFTAAVCTEDLKSIYVTGSDGSLRRIVDRKLKHSMDVWAVLTQLVISHPPQRMMFAATTGGVVRSFVFPLTTKTKDYPCHHGRVTRMRISHDDAFLFTAGEDGVLAVFNIREMRVGGDRTVFSDEVLVSKNALQERSMEIVELRQKVDELTQSNEYSLRTHDINYQDELKEVSEKYNSQIEHNRNKIDILNDEKQELKMMFEARYQAMKADYRNRLYEKDREHKKLVMKEIASIHELERSMEQQQRTYTSRFNSRKERHSTDKAALLAEQARQLQAERYQCSVIEEDIKRKRHEFEETRKQLEMDTDLEIEQLMKKYDKKLRTKQNETLRLNGENSIMKKKFAQLQKEIIEQEETLKQLTDKERQLQVMRQSFLVQLQSHRDDIKERDDTIGLKEAQIYNLKKANADLEKYKFVMDYQIRELKQEMDPRERKISSMYEDIHRLDKQLEKKHKEKIALKSEISGLEATLVEKRKQISRQQELCRLVHRRYNLLANDIYEVVQDFQDPGKLRAGVLRVKLKHIGKGRLQGWAVDPEVAKEYKRQRAYLEQSVDMLRKKVVRDTGTRRSDNVRVMEENIALIKEINRMRRELKSMRQVQKRQELNKFQARGRKAGKKTAGRSSEDGEADWDEQEAEKVLGLQRDTIEELHKQIQRLKSAPVAQPQ